jgi:UDP-N-acetylglucosamine 2-epimerase (non-hydrolysing)
MSRKIAVITGTRAEYGLLYWSMRELQTRDVELHLIVTGAHLSPDHGMTVKQIEADGLPIAARVDMQLTSDSLEDITRSMGIGLSGIAAALSQIKPEMAVILGDRYEMLAAASAASMLHIPIAHIHGGEVTEGAIDEFIRHAITKLSYWHFATAEPYARRIIQLGEEPARVFTVGAPGIDNLVRLPLLARAELEKELGIPLVSPVVLFTYHPETLSKEPVQAQVSTVIAALEKCPDMTLLMTGANSDTGGRAINEALKAFASRRPNALFRMSFGSLLYLSAMKHADVVAGNSSSGMIETPSLGRATVNIGDRQAGRLRTPAVIDCACNETAVVEALRQVLSPEFQQNIRPSPLFGLPGQVGVKIADLLASLSIPGSLRKPFHDLPVTTDTALAG